MGPGCCNPPLGSFCFGATTPNNRTFFHPRATPLRGRLAWGARCTQSPNPIPFVALVGVPPVPADQRTNGVRWALLPRLLGPLDFLRRCRRCRHRRPRCCINVRLQILEIPCISCGCAQPAGHSPTPNRQRHVLGPPSRHATMARERISAWETP